MYTERQLIDEIKYIAREGVDDQTLCENAYNFRFGGYNELLQRLARSRPTTWGHLRHNIGRLGCWYKAASFLTSNAANFANALENFSIDVVRQNVDRPRTPVRIMKLTDLFPENCSEGFDMSLSRMKTVFGTDAMKNANEHLCGHFQNNWRLKYHAEAKMADFFYCENRKFWRGDRYIGCSKGSCYCCDLYFWLHPGNFVRRPCHGNAWVQWQRPALLASPQAGHEMTKRMLQTVEGDVKRAILEGFSGHAFTCDSTTNISSLVKSLGIR